MSKKLAGWKVVSRHLGVTESETNAIKDNDYEQQKYIILNIWKRRGGLQATFKVLLNVFSNQLNDQAMVDIIYELAAVAMTGNLPYYVHSILFIEYLDNRAW